MEKFRPKLEEFERRDTPSGGAFAAIPYGDGWSAGGAASHVGADSSDRPFTVEYDLTAPAVETRPEAAPADLSSAYEYVANYVKKSVRNEKRPCGPVEDIIQDVYVELYRALGPDRTDLTGVLEKHSVEKETLRKAVRRVIDREHYRQDRGEVVSDQIEHLATASRHWKRHTGRGDRDQEMTEWNLDLQGNFGGYLTARQAQVLRGVLDGKTYDEIGRELGLGKQRVCEIYKRTQEQLRPLFAADGTMAEPPAVQA